MMSTNVRGISPLLKFVKEDNRIIMKTTPLAPINPIGNRRTLRTPVTKLVITIMRSKVSDPYVCSSMGPKSRMKAKFERKWLKSA